MRTINVLVLVYSLASAGTTTGMAPPEQSDQSSLSMSPGLLELYRAEMRQLLVGTQAIAVALPTGDWDSIIVTSRKMQKSYVLEGELTAAQVEEIAGLPESFQDLDQAFHARTEKLAAAAADKDAEAAAYQFSRLLETCAVCHARFAQSRFPAFPSEPAEEAHHSHGNGMDSQDQAH